MHGVEVARDQELRASGGVRHGNELDGVEVHLAVPPVLVAHETGHRVRRTAVEHERAGADRLLVERRVGERGGEPRRRRHVAELPGEGGWEERVRLEQVELGGEIVDPLGRPGLGIERLDGEPDERVGLLGLETLDHGIDRDRRSVVEADALPDLDDPLGEVALDGRLDRFGEVGDGNAVLVPGRERVEHGVGHHQAGHRELRRRRVQAVGVGLEPVAERAAGYRRLVGLFDDVLVEFEFLDDRIVGRLGAVRRLCVGAVGRFGARGGGVVGGVIVAVTAARSGDERQAHDGGDAVSSGSPG